jgi:nicotinamidase/pyrazinamidase
VCVSAMAREVRRLGYEVTILLHPTAFVRPHPEGDQAALDDLVVPGASLMGELPGDSSVKRRELMARRR